jgi:hypothetical protein
MKFLMSAALLLSLFGPATAGSVVNERKLRLADAATDACFAVRAGANPASRRVR